MVLSYRAKSIHLIIKEIMKKIISFITVLAISAGIARADEGMWMLPLLQKMNAKAMKELGCKLTPKEIYDINNTSLKDAIVQFGGGCTGEIVSPEGLLLTNHHCGYSNIQKLSSVEHDYLKDGYWAMNRSEELPCEGLTVTFLQSMQDVTTIIEKAKEKAAKEYKDSTDVDKFIRYAENRIKGELVQKAEENNPHCDAEIESFYNSNVYYLIVYKTYRDIRFVGAPPSSIGKFGADTDNWMWPRHTGDFSMFRIYADKDNNPADYSPENVPLRARNSLKISLQGIKKGDYTMIMGFPGRTTRFQTSPELKSQIQTNDIRIAARTIRQNAMLEDMLADPKVKIQYASKYSGSSNGWKKWQGMKLAFDKLKIIERAEQEEAEFTKWVNSSKKRKEKYGNVLQEISDLVAASSKSKDAYTKASESIYRVEITQIAAQFKAKADRLIDDGKDTLEALTTAAKALQDIYKDYSAQTDRKITKAMLKFYKDNAAEEDYFDGLAQMNIDAYTDSIFDNSVFTSVERLDAAIKKDGYAIFQDPAFKTAKQLINKTYALFIKSQEYDRDLAQARELYTAALLEWKKGQPSYPDANFTMRLTYGTVKGYSPKDAIEYRHYTTLDGVMEKENPDSWEFNVPVKLKELWQNKDFGIYAMKDGKMPVAFLSNNDITGGNSGSPIMNARGELVGLAFDGNWESMSSDVMFEPQLQRCINVDIRYVLFIIDKFGGAGWLLDEMTIIK